MISRFLCKNVPNISRFYNNATKPILKMVTTNTMLLLTTFVTL